MTAEARSIYQRIYEDIQRLPLNEFLLGNDDDNLLRSERVENLVKSHTQNAPEKIRQRVLSEFHSWGPVEDLLADDSITEVLINGPTAIWFERQGRLHHHPDHFFSELSYRNFLDRISHAANAHITTEFPCADGRFGDFRLSLVGAELTQTHPHLTLRRHPKNPWTFARLADHQWCTPDQLKAFSKLILERRNFLVVGPTGSGKTSVLNAFLNLLPDCERVVVIEDTSEISLPNKASMKLLTREDPQGVLPSVEQGQLVRRSLRLRPDRLVMGEVRGPEAKDFLMALATGHSGSFGTLHAQDASQALIRLEMLIQMGAPQWSLTAIRRLIQMSLDYVVVAERSSTGQRQLKGLYRLCSLEENGFLLEKEI
ncbi:ATPase, T2SS/T4P/T4SS family [Bdellovibrio bacteriovorus]|uniref:CpaF family protein n=1 Tax=Bdellovibrio bacteriovorus TaxID=959 RepID=UPI0021CE2DD5|nr:ATPase, T2SS/T4P/T4SS family [Bdellovibrio bacteriovorus]UXR64341.1 ATPase, T2SS/T4P/T4SS family [Bdellovibrio bacteriovorus]